MKIGRSLEISNGGWESALLHHIGGEEKNVGLYFGFCGDSDNDLESISLSLHLHRSLFGFVRIVPLSCVEEVKITHFTLKF